MKFDFKIIKIKQNSSIISLFSTSLNINHGLIVWFVYMCSCECISRAKVIYVNTLRLSCEYYIKIVIIFFSRDYT